MLPDFFVIGAQKAGSTFLMQCLEEHPQIFMPPAEVSFFEDSRYAPDEFGWFQRHFDSAREGQVVGVKRPNLLGHPECPERLRKHMPRLQLMVILRHPVERAVSGYFHYARSGFIPIVPLEVGMRRLLDGDYDHLLRAREILEFGFYHQQLVQYERYFPRDRIHVILLDDIKRDALNELAKTYRFLGVRADFRPASLTSRPMAATYSLPRLRLWNLLDWPCRSWTADGKYVERRRGPVFRSLYALNVAADRFVWSRLFTNTRPSLPDDLRAELAALYRADIEGLEGWLRRSLTAWRESVPC